MDTELYSIGAYFCDEHPDLVDEVVARSEEIERRGLEAYSGHGGAARGDLRDAPHRARRSLLQGGRRLGGEPLDALGSPGALIALGVGRAGLAILSISVGRAGRDSAVVGGVNDVQRILGGIRRTAPTSALPTPR